MRTNNRKAAGQPRPITLRTIGREKGAGILRTMERFSFALNKFHISLRQAKAAVDVVIRNALNERLSRTQRHRNKLAKDRRITNGKRRNHQARRTNKHQSRTQSFAAFVDDWKQQGDKRRKQKGVGSEPAGNANERTRSEEQEQASGSMNEVLVASSD